MKRTQTPQVVVLCLSIVLMIAYAMTGFSAVVYICLALVALYIGAALMLDYDAWMDRRKEERQNREAFNMLMKHKDHKTWLRIRLIDTWRRMK